MEDYVVILPETYFYFLLVTVYSNVIMDPLLRPPVKKYREQGIPRRNRRQRHDAGRSVKGRVEIFLTIRMSEKYYPTLTRHEVI